MGSKPVQRYKDVDFYITEIEEVYDLLIDIDFSQNIRASTGLQPFTIKAWDKDDDRRDQGPILYVTSECHVRDQHKRQQALIRALTSITFQALERFVALSPQDV